MARVQIRGLEKRFGALQTVRDINLTVEDGEFVTILGPSGCGKSTLLRMVAGLEKPSAGSVRIGDTDATALHPKDRNVAMVFQNYALYPHLTIRRNIAFPLEVNHHPSREIAGKVLEAAKIVRLEHLLDRKPRQLSGGERQRAALARALVRDPTVFLLDEPLSNLDAKLRHTAREELRLLQQRIGITALYVTHDQIEAMGLGDRIVVMNAGSIRQIGTPEQVYKHPSDVFVATFMGTPPMNLVEVGEHLVGLRPENLFLPGTFGSRTDIARLAVRVERVEYLGGMRLIYAATVAPLTETRIIASVAVGSGDLTPDSLATLEIPRDELRLFDKATGLAVANPAAILSTVFPNG